MTDLNVSNTITIFAALAHPMRMQILQRLACCDATASELASPLKVTASTISKHLKTLEEATLITSSQLDNETKYHLNSDALDSPIQEIQDLKDTRNRRPANRDCFLDTTPIDPLDA